jgi:hypothetical protein
MKHKKLKFTALLLLGIGLTGLQAQSTLYVKEQAGTQTPYTLSNIRKLTFFGGNMIVNKTSGSNDSYVLNNIRYVNFTDLTTGISQTNKAESNNIILFPNPVTDQLQLTYETPKAGNVHIEILDIQGRVVQQQTIISQDGINRTIIPVSQLSMGIYICRIQSNDKIETIKFIKN